MIKIKCLQHKYSHCIREISLSPDPFFASLFSFLFVRDTNLAHPIKNCSLHSLVFVQPQKQTWIKEAHEKKNAKMQDIYNKETKTTAASLQRDEKLVDLCCRRVQHKQYCQILLPDDLGLFLELRTADHHGRPQYVFVEHNHPHIYQILKNYAFCIFWFGS